MDLDCINTSAPKCPHCHHEFDTDDMNACDEDLWALAPDEGYAQIACPSCDREFHISGSYKPQYTTAVSEDEL